jgi:hypothetical protein
MEADGSLAPWRSPAGVPLALRAAVAFTSWTDLGAAIAPNGAGLGESSPSREPLGPASAGARKFILEPGEQLADAEDDPSVADFRSWFEHLPGTEPDDEGPTADEISAELRAFHSAAGIDDSVAPAPTLLVSGLSDDLFPADQSIAYAERVRARHPDARIGVLIADVGHLRGQSKPEDVALSQQREAQWIDHYLAGVGPPPATGVELWIQTCDGPSQGPLRAADIRAMAPGEVRFREPAPRELPASADDAADDDFDSADDKACATVPAEETVAGVAYDMPVGADGFVMAGSAVVGAAVAGEPGSQVAARLLDVDPAGEARLIARGAWLPPVDGRHGFFRLNTNAWRFEPGHTLRLQLLPGDEGYADLLPTQAPLTVSGLSLVLPVLGAAAPAAAG